MALTNGFKDVATEDSLRDILAKLIATPATAQAQETQRILLSQILAALTAEGGYLDGVEALLSAGNGSLGTIVTALAGTIGITANILPLPSGAAKDSTLDLVRQLMASLVSLVGTQAVATGLPGSPANQAISVQGVNEQRTFGPVTKSVTGDVFFTVDLSTSDNPFTAVSVQTLAVGTGASVLVRATNDPDKAVWTNVQLQAADNANVSGAIGSAPTLVYAFVPYRYVQLYLGAGGSSGPTTVIAQFVKASPTNRNVTIGGGSSATGSGFTAQPVGIGVCARTADSLVANGAVAAPLASREGASVQRLHAIPESTWNYAAAAGGITTATAATVKTAVTGLRNYVTGLQLSNASATATEFVIRDGTGGTVLWRCYLAANTAPFTVNFAVPLRGTAATLLEAACLTAGAAAYLSLQGFVAA